MGNPSRISTVSVTNRLFDSDKILVSYLALSHISLYTKFELRSSSRFRDMGFQSWKFGVNNLPMVPVLEVKIYSYRLRLFVYKIWGFYLYPFSSYGILNFPYMLIATDTH